MEETENLKSKMEIEIEIEIAWKGNTQEYAMSLAKDSERCLYIHTHIGGHTAMHGMQAMRYINIYIIYGVSMM